MDVDETGGDQPAAGVDLLRAAAVDFADRGDLAIVDGDIPDERVPPRSVDDGSAPNHTIEHRDHDRSPLADQSRLIVDRPIDVTTVAPVGIGLEDGRSATIAGGGAMTARRVTTGR
jgi:hypothetical protein